MREGCLWIIALCFTAVQLYPFQLENRLYIQANALGIRRSRKAQYQEYRNLSRSPNPEAFTCCKGDSPTEMGIFCSEPAHESFIALMGEARLPLSPQDEIGLRRLSEAYEQNIGLLSAAPIHCIPHTIHVIWLGPKPFPEYSIPNLISWKTHHPDWQFFFWTDSPSRPTPIPGMTKRLVEEYDFGIVSPFIALSNNWAEKADMMRYAILFKEGGVYADHDVFCERSVAELADHFEFVAACDPSQPHPGIGTNIIVNNSTILSRPQHPLLGAALERIVKGWNGVQEQFPGTDRESTLARVGLRTLLPFVEAAKEYCQKRHSRDIILPASYFYSLGLFQPATLKALEGRGFVYVVHKG